MGFAALNPPTYRVMYHSPNTYNIVALRCSLTSGEFTSVRRPVV